MVRKKNKPKFNVPNYGFMKSVKARWRKPKGTHNKKRMKFEWCGAHPRVGYKNTAEIRGMHPAGMREVLVCNEAELDGLKEVLVRISGSVGMRKRLPMEEKAKKLGLRVLNPKALRQEKEEGAKKGAMPAAKTETKPAAAQTATKTPATHAHGGAAHQHAGTAHPASKAPHAHPDTGHGTAKAPHAGGIKPK